MAEKEERILILTGNKDNYPAWNYSHGPLYLDEYYYDGISRQEAIERIAKAICANEDEYADCKQCEFNGPEDCKRYYRNNWLYTAEAALNALLGEK